MEDNLIKLERWAPWKRKIPYGKIGYGYKVNPDDPYEIIPDPEVIKYLEQGFDYLDSGSSLREVCEWLGQHLLCSITHQTVSNLYKKHRKPYLRVKTEKKTQKPLTAAQRKLRSAQTAHMNAERKRKKAEEEYQKNKNKLKPSDYVTPPEVKERPKNLPHLRDESYTPPPPPVPKNVSFVFKPNPGPQTDFLAATEEEVLYGGSAGGGKSYAMLADPMRYFNNPNFVGLLLRRTNDELRELKWESQKLYPKAFPGAKWKEKDSMWVFPSGAKFWMTYLERDDDVLRYQGQAFTWIGVDELTQYATPFAWTYLKSRLRTSDPELKKTLSMRATTNPGGPGHQWVKKMFVDPAPEGQSFWARDVETGDILKYPDNHDEVEKRGKPLFKRRFIPARLKDNPYLAEDGAYERSLHGLPEDQRRKLLDGDWSVMEGAAFAEFNPKYHVCEPFDIPNDWRRFRSADYGYSSPSCVLWFAIDSIDNTLYVYRELYGSGMTGQDLAAKVLELEQGEKIQYGILDSSVWHQRGHYGPSIAEEMIQAGCRWRPSDRGQGSRVSGKNRLHELLKVEMDNLGYPHTGIVIFNNCRQLIADLPTIPKDPNGGDDIDIRYRSDHSYDALRYGIMSRPKASNPFGWEDLNTQGRSYNPSDPIFGY